MQWKTILSIAGVIILLGAVAVLLSVLPKPYVGPSTTTVTTSDQTAQQPPISAAKVPDGWYEHQTNGIDKAITILSRTKDLPTSSTSEQISVSSVKTSLSPEDFIPKQGLVGGSLNSPNAQWSWGVYQGHKTFSMTISANGISQWFVYVFGGQTVKEFVLSPNDQSNSNLAQDRTDFWRVITYYTQDSSFEKLSRLETLQNCKTTTLPDGQNTNTQVDPEDGYVVANFTQDSKTKYVFLNYNDDLSQCTPSVNELLQNVKRAASKLPH